MRNFISLPEAQDILRPRMSSLTKSFSDAFSTWMTDYARHHVALDASARAKILHGHFYFNAGQNLCNDKGVEFREDQLQRFLLIDERLILRFKLLDHNLQASNYPTQRAQEWVKQLPLEGFPPCERLHFGYRLDLTGTVIQDAFIALPNGIQGIYNDWVWQVWGNPMDMTTFGVQLPFPQAPYTVAPAIVYAYDDYSVRSA